MPKETLLVIDGHAIAHRALHSKFASSPGARFFRLVSNLITKFDPRYLAIAVDSPRETLKRREKHAGYKANRKEPDPQLRILFRQIFKACKQLGIAVVGFPRWEADDVMGTLSRMFSEEDIEVVLVSPDKDLGQLIRPGVRLFDPMKQVEVTREDVIKKFGVRPKQIPDYLAIVGDRIDGIPGVPKLGARAAQRILARYKNLEELCSDGIWEGGPAASVARQYEHLKLFRDLTKVRTRLPLEVTLNDLAFKGYKIKNATKSLQGLRAQMVLKASGLTFPYPHKR